MLEQLFVRYYRPLIRFFSRRVGNLAEAEDLAQDVFVKLSRYTDQTELGSPDGLVFTIAANVLKDRNALSRNRLVDAISEHQGLTGSAKRTPEGLIDQIAPDRIVAGQELAEMLACALDELSEKTRTIFLLFKFQGMRQKEIAGNFGISVSAVEKHIVIASTHVISRMGPNVRD